MADIAKQAGVAKSTVSMALRNHPRISEKQRMRIQEIAEQMGYRSNAIVARLMHELRKSGKHPHSGTIALINTSHISDVYQMIGVMREWKAAVQSRADSMGYSVNHFWLHEAGMTPVRLLKILQTRNVQGLVFYALDPFASLDRWECVWNHFPGITAGGRLDEPPLSFVTNDQYSTAFHAFRTVHEYGYRRPGLAIARWLERKHDNRFSSGAYGFMKTVTDQPVPTLYLDAYAGIERGNDLDSDKRCFVEWMKKEKPDVVLSIDEYILEWIKEAGLRVPRDIGFALLDLPKELEKQVAGMKQQQVAAGMAAVDMLTGLMLRRENGPPLFQKAMLVESHWVEGMTVKRR